MSNFLKYNEMVPVDVLVVDPAFITDPKERKSVLAMQTTILSASNDERVAHVRQQAREAADELGVTPQLTYEDVIFNNRPIIYPCVMSTDPTTANAEAKLYNTYYEFEQGIKRAVDMIVAGNGKDAAQVIVSTAAEFRNAFREDTENAIDPDQFVALSQRFSSLDCDSSLRILADGAMPPNPFVRGGVSREPDGTSSFPEIRFKLLRDISPEDVAMRINPADFDEETATRLEEAVQQLNDEIALRLTTEALLGD